jgi:hypothetical protein
MNNLMKIATSGALVAGVLSFIPVAAQAGYNSGSYERAQTCKQMRRDGSLQWYSIASGTINSGSGRSGYSGFVTKACHTNKTSCSNWLRNINYEIGNLDRIETAYCQRVR